MKRYLILRIAVLGLFVLMCTKNYAQSKQAKIKIIDFKIENLNNRINLFWATKNTDRDNYFEVERSNDGRNFKTVAIILGPDPAKGDREYDCVDKNITKKPSYYRVKHIGSDGETQFSETKMINLK